MATDTKFCKMNLVTGENTYASASASNPADARRLQSLIPSLSGALEREHPAVALSTTTLPSRVGFFHQFNRNNSGVIAFHFFCATATNLYELIAGVWTKVTAIGNLAGFPQAINIDNCMQLDDAGNGKSWLFDGANWIPTGFPIPLHSPTFTTAAPPAATTIVSISRSNNVVGAQVTSIAGLAVGMSLAIAGVVDTSFNQTTVVITAITGVGPTINWAQIAPDAASTSGTATVAGVTIISNRYYWTVWEDQTITRTTHDSSSSPISAGTGAQTAKIFKVHMRFGTATTADGISYVGVGTDWSQDDVGQVIYAGVFGGNVSLGVINAVADASHLSVDPLATPYQPHSVTGANFNIAPVRTTHWLVFASATEEDKLGSLLARVPITQTEVIDDSPMIGTIGSIFANVQRPLLDDPPPASPILEVYKRRIWRRDPKLFNFFDFTAKEEVDGQGIGNPYECVPGTDPNTRSADLINEDSYPDQSIAIRGMKAHGDSLYIGSEKDIIPLYGDDNTNFSLSQVYAFKVGLAGRYAWCSTPFGLAFDSYDRKTYLYPSQYNFGVDSTTALVELSRPKRPEFRRALGSDLDNNHLIFYNFGERNWLVKTFQRNDATFHTWIFDFEAKGWFELQQGYTAVGVFEVTPGNLVLVGAGAADNRVYVIDDLTGTYDLTGKTYPAGTFRQLVDFSDPNVNYVIQNIEFEVSNPQMEVDVSVWLDPLDPENPGNGIPVPMTITKIGAGKFRGTLTSQTGGTCQRALVEYLVAASQQNGQLRGITITADKLPKETK